MPEAAPSSCARTTVPLPPAADDPSDGGDVTVLIALHTLDLGLTDAGQLTHPVGYDLDGVYTCCDGGAESCKSAVNGATHCDTSGGRDDSSSALLGTLESVDPIQFNAGLVNERLAGGSYTVLIQLLHYNGTANDTAVTAAVYGSDGVERDAGPRWNGTDHWSIDETFVASPDASPLIPTHIDGNAYVVDGVFVFHVDFPITFGGGSTGVAITLAPGVVTGTLSRNDAGAYTVRDGVIAGRWSVANILTAIQSLRVMGQTICPGSQLFSFVKSEICQYADLTSDPTLDRTGAACDALSLGVGFTADPALLGAVRTASPAPPLCGDAALDPGTCTGN